MKKIYEIIGTKEEIEKFDEKLNSSDFQEDEEITVSIKEGKIEEE